MLELVFETTDPNAAYDACRALDEDGRWEFSNWDQVKVAVYVLTEQDVDLVIKMMEAYGKRV